jgi:hypothetical protein
MKKCNDCRDEILNATTCIAGILARVKSKRLYVIKSDGAEIERQLRRIENIVNYVQQLNKGD